LPATVSEAGGDPTSTEAGDDFDFWRDVIGDDLVVGGVVYNARIWEPDGEGGVRRIEPAGPDFDAEADTAETIEIGIRAPFLQDLESVPDTPGAPSEQPQTAARQPQATPRAGGQNDPAVVASAAFPRRVTQQLNSSGPKAPIASPSGAPASHPAHGAQTPQGRGD
jgi:hypothetical protein